MPNITPNWPKETYPKKLQILANIYEFVSSICPVTDEGKKHMPYCLTRREKIEAENLLKDLIKEEGKKEGVEIIDNTGN